MLSFSLSLCIEIPKEKGQTSNNEASFSNLPIINAAFIEDPYATASSGFNQFFIIKKILRIFGIFVEPPTKIISSILFLFILTFSKISLTGFEHKSNLSLHNYSKSNLVNSNLKFFCNRFNINCCFIIIR